MRAACAIPVWLVGWPAWAQSTGGEEATRAAAPLLSSGLLTQLTLGLLIVLGLAIGLSWMLRRYTVPREGLIRVIGGLPLGTRERLLLIEVNEVRLLIGITGQRIQTLHVFVPPADPFPLAPEIPHHIPHHDPPSA